MYTEQEAPFDWPFYGEVEEGGKEVEDARVNYRAVLSLTDNYLGKILDFMHLHK